jgi:hypothetical protein
MTSRFKGSGLSTLAFAVSAAVCVRMQVAIAKAPEREGASRAAATSTPTPAPFDPKGPWARVDSATQRFCSDETYRAREGSRTTRGYSPFDVDYFANKYCRCIEEHLPPQPSASQSRGDWNACFANKLGDYAQILCDDGESRVGASQRGTMQPGAQESLRQLQTASCHCIATLGYGAERWKKALYNDCLINRLGAGSDAAKLWSDLKERPGFRELVKGIDTGGRDCHDDSDCMYEQRCSAPFALASGTTTRVCVGHTLYDSVWNEPKAWTACPQQAPVICVFRPS